MAYWENKKTELYDAVHDAKQNDLSISVNSVLKKLNISASGYYGHFKSEPSKSKQRKIRLTKEIKDIYEKSYRIYGSPK